MSARDAVRVVREALALHRSMAVGGEAPSDASNALFERALSALAAIERELEEAAEELESARELAPYDIRTAALEVLRIVFPARQARGWVRRAEQDPVESELAQVERVLALLAEQAQLVAEARLDSKHG